MLSNVIISLYIGRLDGIQTEITVPSVPSSKSLSIPVITRLIVSTCDMGYVYRRDSESKPGTPGTELITLNSR